MKPGFVRSIPRLISFILVGSLLATDIAAAATPLPRPISPLSITCHTQALTPRSLLQRLAWSPSGIRILKSVGLSRFLPKVSQESALSSSQNSSEATPASDSQSSSQTTPPSDTQSSSSAQPVADPPPPRSRQLPITFYQTVGELVADVSQVFLQTHISDSAVFLSKLGPELDRRHPSISPLLFKENSRQRLTLSRLVSTAFHVADSRQAQAEMARESLRILRWFLDDKTRNELDKEATRISNERMARTAVRLLNLNLGGPSGKQFWNFTRFHVLDLGSPKAKLALGFQPQLPRFTMSGLAQLAEGSIRVFSPEDEAAYLEKRETGETTLEDALYADTIQLARFLKSRGVNPLKRFDPTFPSALINRFDRLGIIRGDLSLENVSKLPLPGEASPAAIRPDPTDPSAAFSENPGYLAWTSLRAAFAQILGALQNPDLKGAVLPKLEESPDLQTALFGQGQGPRVWLLRADLTPIHSYKLFGALAKILFVTHEITSAFLAKLSTQEILRSKPLSDVHALGHDSEHILQVWQRKRMVFVAASAGNHAQGVALAANAASIRSLIFLPNNASPVKVEAIRKLGAEIRSAGDDVDAALVTAQNYELTHEGAIMISPSEPRVMAGHAAIGLSMLDQAHRMGIHPDVVVTPVGTGGFLTGMHLAVTSNRFADLGDIHPSPSPDKKTMVTAVESHLADAFTQSIAANMRVMLAPFREGEKTIADGTMVRQVGLIPWLRLRWAYIRGDLTLHRVPEPDVEEAIRMMDDIGIRAEGGGALALASVFSDPERYASLENIVLVVSGGNIDDTRFNRVTRPIKIGAGAVDDILANISLPAPSPLLVRRPGLYKPYVSRFTDQAGQLRTHFHHYLEVALRDLPPQRLSIPKTLLDDLLERSTTLNLNVREVEEAAYALIRLYSQSGPALMPFKRQLYQVAFQYQLPWLQAQLSNASPQERLRRALALSAFGNAVGSDAFKRALQDHSLIEPTVLMLQRQKSLTFDNRPLLAEQLQGNPKKVLILLDNVLEDINTLGLVRELIEQGHHVTLAAKSEEAYNDTTVDDVRWLLAQNEVQAFFGPQVNVAQIKVVSTGSSARGNDPRRATPEFIQAWREAHVIVVQGEGSSGMLTGLEKGFYSLFAARSELEITEGARVGHATIRYIRPNTTPRGGPPGIATLIAAFFMALTSLSTVFQGTSLPARLLSTSA